MVHLHKVGKLPPANPEPSYKNNKKSSLHILCNRNDLLNIIASLMLNNIDMLHQLISG